MKRVLVSLQCRAATGLLATLLVFALALSINPARSEVSTTEAEVVVSNLAAEIWDVLGEADLGDQERVDALTALLVANADVPLLSRLVLGRYWPQLDDEQRIRYQQLFRDVVMRNFASKLNQFAKEAKGPLKDRFALTSSAHAGKRDVLIRSIVKPETGDPLAVDWRLRDGGKGPVVIDLIIEGVSLLVSQRSEFAAVIERSNMEGLLAELQARASASS